MELSFFEVGFEEHRPHLERRPQAAEDVRRVGVGRVARQDQVRAGLRERVGEAGDADPVAQAEDDLGDEPEEPLEQAAHGGQPVKRDES